MENFTADVDSPTVKPLRLRVLVIYVKRSASMRCAKNCKPCLQTAQCDDDNLVATDRHMHCGFMDLLGADWFSASTSYGPFHLCSGGLWGQRKRKQVSHFFPPREGAAPLYYFLHDFHQQGGDKQGRPFKAHPTSQRLRPSSRGRFLRAVPSSICARELFRLFAKATSCFGRRAPQSSAGSVYMNVSPQSLVGS